MTRASALEPPRTPDEPRRRRDVAMSAARSPAHRLEPGVARQDRRRPLPRDRGDRPRRHGRRVPRRAPAHGQGRGDEGPAPRPRERPRGRRSGSSARPPRSSKLHHPHTVQVFDFGTAQGALYLIMEYVRGLDLARIIERDGPMPWSRAAPLLAQICGALAGSARARHRPPRSQAGERADHAHHRRPRLREGARLRPRQARAARARADDRDRPPADRRHAVLHVARADPRRRGRRAHRHLLVRRADVRAAHRRSTCSPARPRSAC